MVTQGPVFDNLTQEYTISIEQILEVITQEFNEQDISPLKKMLSDFVNLYEGKWPQYEKCQTGYHNLRHAIEVALVAIRMAAGYNLVEVNNKFTYRHFKIILVASLFHDSGYLKSKGDQEGTGGKYTFTHVERSKKIAKDYLTSENWNDNDIDLISKSIGNTEFSEPPILDGIIIDQREKNIAKIVGTADLIAQMADVDYMENIKQLFSEFKEAYEFHGADYLKKNNIKVYKSAEDMVSQTFSFYNQFVIPRIELLGRQDKYLISFFGEGRNPYLENISVNISRKPSKQQAHWRRIGDILRDFGVIDDKQIREALEILKEFQKKHPVPNEKPIPFRERFFSWLKGENCQKNLGLVLVEEEMVNPSLLRKGLIDQITPLDLINELEREDVLFLLHSSIMLHNISKDPWVFEQILMMANEQLSCEASTILLANPDKREMVIAVSTTMEKNFYLGRTIPVDKGLSGWVFLQDQAAIVDNIESDERYDVKIDKRVNFEPRCILAVPLHVNGNPIGVMEFFNKKESGFDDNDIRKMSLLANIIASSLSKALTLNGG